MTDNSPPAGMNTATLGVGEALARLIAFGASLLIARRLGPDAFGVIGVASGLLLYLTQVADQGIELVGVPLVARDELRARPVVSATLAYRMLAALGLAAIVGLIARVVLPAPDGRVLALYAPTLVLAAASTRWVLLGLRHPGVVAVARVAGELVALAMVAMLVQLPADLPWVPLAAIAGGLLTAMVMLVGTWRAGMPVSVSFRWADCRELFVRGRPIVAFTLLGLILFNFDLIFLRFVKGEAAAGEYAAAYTFIAFASNLIVAFAHSVMPSLARSRDAEAGGDGDRLYGGAVTQVVALTLPAAIGGAVVASSLVTLVFGDAFLPGAVALRWLVLSLPFAAIREIAVVAVIASGGERSLVRVNLVTVVCNVALNLILVPTYGLAGAAAATLTTEVIRLALAYRAAALVGFHFSSLRRLVKPIVATIVMGVALYLTGGDSLWRAVLAGAAAYGVALVALGGVRFRGRALPDLTL
ncbi:MAG: oligosaccharide flippase family protein [Gemmatimonadaceae bacterium]